MSGVAFHLGYHKTASTWFQRVALPRHPDVRVFLDGALGEDPFLRQIILTPDRSFDLVRARADFARRCEELAPPAGGVVVVSEERLSGHAATGGYDAFGIGRRLAEVAPDAKVFFVAREQVSMIESEYLQLLQEGSVASLEWLLEFRPRAATMPGFDLAQYEYDRLADHYAGLFGRDNVRVFDFTAVTRDPAAFLDELADHLGIARWPALTAEELRRRVNPGIPKRLLGLRRFLNRFERRPLNPHPLFTLPRVWHGPLWWLAARLPPRRRPLLAPEAQAMLRARYRESNARLAERYGVELTGPA